MIWVRVRVRVRANLTNCTRERSKRSCNGQWVLEWHKQEANVDIDLEVARASKTYGHVETLLKNKRGPDGMVTHGKAPSCKSVVKVTKGMRKRK